jgi:hypothetical protein
MSEKEKTETNENNQAAVSETKCLNREELVASQIVHLLAEQQVPFHELERIFMLVKMYAGHSPITVVGNSE